MARICNPCNTDDIVAYQVPCEVKKGIRKAGISNFAVIKCDKTITDLTDDTEWSDLKTSGDIVASPKGFGNLISPETTTEQLDGCSPEEVIDEISGFDFYTKFFDNENFTDFDFETQLKNLYSSYTIVWLGCDGLLYYNSNWVSGENPGFPNFIPTVYRDGDAGSLQKLNMNIRFNSYNNNLKAFKPSQEVINAIFG